jgi:hypothetical protein
MWARFAVAADFWTSKNTWPSAEPQASKCHNEKNEKDERRKRRRRRREIESESDVALFSYALFASVWALALTGFVVARFIEAAADPVMHSAGSLVVFRHDVQPKATHANVQSAIRRDGPKIVAWALRLKGGFLVRHERFSKKAIQQSQF